MSNHFNLFEILFKDDKELSHSAAVKFLLEENDGFYFTLLQCNKPLNPVVILEYKLNKYNRADILIIGEDKVIIIENKFKCLPYKTQLEEYSHELNQKFPGKKTEKYLLYFHKSDDFDIPEDWKQITYYELKSALENYVPTITAPDKKMFLQHYLESLKNYTEKYLVIKEGNNLEPFFKGEEGNYGFWLNLIFHELKSIICKKRDYRVFVGSGNTYVPFINVHHPDWTYEKRDNVEAVIQLNGQKLKYYMHLDRIHNQQERIKRVEKEICCLQDAGFEVTPSGEFKKLTGKAFKTCFVYQENLLDRIKSKNEEVTIEAIFWAIEDLIKRIPAVEDNIPETINISAADI